MSSAVAVASEVSVPPEATYVPVTNVPATYAFFPDIMSEATASASLISGAFTTTLVISLPAEAFIVSEPVKGAVVVLVSLIEAGTLSAVTASIVWTPLKY